MKLTIKNGVTIHCIKSNKFKDVAICINFLGELNEESATVRSLLALMLSDRSAKYDTKQKVSILCDQLYGATFSCRTLGCGGGHIIEVRSKIINPMYIEANANLFHDQLGFINEMIFNPLMKDGHFSQEVFDEAKHILESKIRRRMDDAQTYSILRALQLAGGNQPLGIATVGSLTKLKSVTIEDVENYYHKMIHEDLIEVVACGEFDELHMVKAIEESFAFKPRSKEVKTYYVLDTQPRLEQVTEHKDIPQSNIAMVYQTKISVLDPLYPALKVANGIFGQYTTSFLFQEVREKHSLCYSIFSNLITFDGAMLVSTGVEDENIDQAISLIREQFIKCKNGEFDEELINVTKKMLINALNSSLDEMSSMISYAYNNSILQRELSIEENIACIAAVSKEDIMKVFASWIEVLTFVLRKKENNNESSNIE